MNITEDFKTLAQLIEQDTRQTGGASFNLNGEKPPARGYMVSLPGTEWRIKAHELNEYTITHYIGKNLAVLFNDPEQFVGTWIDEETGQVCLDVSLWEESEEEARELGEFGKQKAIYNLATGESITL